MNVSRKEVNEILGALDVFMDKNPSRSLFDGREEEIKTYLMESSDRYYQILQLVDKQLSSKKRVRVLDIGANPFGLTTLLYELWGDKVELVCITRSSEIWPGRSEQVTPKKYHVRSISGVFDVPAWELNVERDIFPFADSSFDLAICALVIEMLIFSPTHVLTETHRVLKEGSKLILNTTNALKIQRLFKHLMNRSSEFPYSGYGVYGRPNRLFCMSELRCLLEGCNYKITEAKLITPSRTYSNLTEKALFALIKAFTSIPIPYLVNKRDQIFIVAQSTGTPHAHYPGFLYASRHSESDG